MYGRHHCVCVFVCKSQHHACVCDLLIVNEPNQNYIQTSLAGDDLSVIGDLGAGLDISLLRPWDALANMHTPWGVRDPFDTLVEGHTYAAVLARRDTRAVVFYTVAGYSGSGPVTLQYAVKMYQTLAVAQEAPGMW